MALSSTSPFPTVLLVGASVRAAAASALRAGYDPWCADLFGDADLAAYCSALTFEHYPHDLPKVLREAPAGPWMYTGAIENHPRIVAEVAAERELWGVDDTSLRRVRDPWRVRDALRHHGLAAPALARSSSELPRDGSWLVKRWRSAGGRHVRVFAGPDPDEPRDCYFQQRIAGVSCSAVFVGAAGRAALLGATRQLIGEPWTGATGFRYAGSIGPLVLPAPIVAQLNAVGTALGGSFALRGLFGVDFILDDDRVWPVEVNPRYTASVEILERATESCSIRFHAEACRTARLPEPAEITPTADKLHGKAILFAEKEIHISPSVTSMLLAVNAGHAWPLVADIPRAGSRIEPGGPVATVFASGSSADDVVAKLRGEVAALSRVLGISPPAA